MKKILFIVPVIGLLAASCNLKQEEVIQTPTPTSIVQNTTPTPSVIPTVTSRPTPKPTVSATITLDASTKAAVVKAIINSFDILSSNDIPKIRDYLLIQALTPESKAQIKVLTDVQLLQVAANVAAAGKPSADLATYPASTAIWELKGNVVTIRVQGSKGWGNGSFYQAVYVDGAWH